MVYFPLLCDLKQLISFLLLRQILSGTENTTENNARGATSIKSPKGAHEKAGSVGKGGEQPFLYQHNVYAPQPQALYPGG